MALIHEKLYQSESLSQIDFGVYVKDLLANIKGVSSQSHSVEVELEYDTFNLNVNQAVPCALIINEIVSNAFEHAFIEQDNGLVRVLLEEQDDRINITVSDNGRGLPADFDDKESESLGFTIIDTLLKQLDADKQIENNDGFSFAFSFQRQEVKGSVSSLIDEQ